MPAIRAASLSKVYRLYSGRSGRVLEWLSLGSRRFHTPYAALHELSFTVERGESIGIIGRNGSGKSTLLKLLSGVAQPTGGDVEAEGTIAALLELGAGFHPDYTGRQNALINAMLLGLRRDEAERRLRAMVEFAEIGPFIDQPIRTYSSGMRSRLAFAVTTVIDPAILLIDEVLAVGDSYFVHKCIRHMQERVRHGCTLLFVSHDLFLVRQLCRRVLWLEAGRLRMDGTSEQVCRDYERFVRDEENRRLLAATPRGRAGQAEQITISKVELLDERGNDAAMFKSGAALTVRVHYRSSITYRQPNVGVTLERVDGLVMCVATALESGFDTGGVTPGEGHFDVVFGTLLFSPQTYRVSVSITLNDLLADGTTNFDRLENAREFKVYSEGRAYNSVIDHPVVWRHWHA